MIRTDLLQGKMRERGYTIESLARELGRTRTSVFNKIHNKTEFSVGEIQTIKKVLCLSDPDALSIFFNHDVELNSTN